MDYLSVQASSQWRKVQDRLEADERCSRLEKIERLEIFQVLVVLLILLTVFNCRFTITVIIFVITVIGLACVRNTYVI